jgi:hypothetical protein
LITTGFVTQAQLKWAAYDTSGNLISANAGTGGDATQGGAVTFTIPAGATYTFITTNFTPVTLAASQIQQVSFAVNASGGFGPSGTPIQNKRFISYGLFNYGATPPSTTGSFTDDVGLWTDSYQQSANIAAEVFGGTSSTNNLLGYTSSKQLGAAVGPATGRIGQFTDGTNVNVVFRLVENAGGTASIGTGTATNVAGAWYSDAATGGTFFNQSIYSAGATTPNGTTTFNEFGLMFYNSTAASVTLTLSNLTLVPLGTANPNQLQWRSYDTSGNQVSGAAGFGGNNLSGSAVTFNVPAGATYTFVTTNFTPVTLAASQIQQVSFAMNASGGFGPSGTPIQNQRFISYGLFNYGTTPPSTTGSFTDDVGLWTDSYQQSANIAAEVFGGTSPSANLLAYASGNKLGAATGPGTGRVGQFMDGTNVNVVFRLVENAGGTASIGTGTATNVAGAWYSDTTTGGTFFNQSIYSAGATTPNGTTTFNEFGFMFYNSTAASVTLTLSNLTLNPPATISSMSVASLAPSNSATGICYDTPLYLTFSSAPKLNGTGKIQIYNVNDSTTPVDTIDLSQSVTNNPTFAANVQPYTIGGDTFTNFPVIITGNTAAIYPHHGLLASNQTYYVTVDFGAFLDSAGGNFTGITATNLWKFTTKVGGPANPTNLVVAVDSSGDFATVQGAVDSIPSANTTPTLITISNGNYVEVVNIKSKHNLTLRGQSRNGTVVTYANNANLQPSTHSRMAMKINANDIVLDTLTVSNSTPQGGSQAEALMIESNAKRCLVNNCEIDSRQDTILANQNSSQAYFYQSLIKGNFDYIWGGGNLFFDQCEIRTIAGASGFNVTAARTDTSATTSTNFPWANPGGTYTANGMSFVRCTFTADANVGSITLAGSNGTAGNNVSWYGCDFATNYVAPSGSLFGGNYVFWQASNTMTNAPVTFANVTTHSGSDPEMLAATNLPTWFYGWQPQLAVTPANSAPVFNPIITSTNINVGVNLSVSCSATDSDLPAQTLTYALLAGGPSGAVLNANTGSFTWRPNVSQANSTNTVTVSVTDNGTPNLSTTNTFKVKVNPLTLPTVSSPGYVNGAFSVTISGQVGPDYALQATTNLASGIWVTIASTNSPASMPVILTDPNASAHSQQFYRTVVGPPLP